MGRVGGASGRFDMRQNAGGHHQREQVDGDQDGGDDTQNDQQFGGRIFIIEFDKRHLKVNNNARDEREVQKTDEPWRNPPTTPTFDCSPSAAPCSDRNGTSPSAACRSHSCGDIYKQVGKC